MSTDQKTNGMRAMIVKEFGGPDVFQEVEVPRPVPGHGQVLIKVMATSVNPIDTKVRQFPLPMTPALPAILHGDVAGIVENVGAGVTQFAPGDSVFGCPAGFRGKDRDYAGALAEYMIADAVYLAHKPDNIDFLEAAALPLVSLTAWMALRDTITLRAGQKVLIQGGTGGVGHIALQLARLSGATIYTTVSTPEKAALAKSLGADVTIDYRTLDPEAIKQDHTNGVGFDVIFDTVGGAMLDAAFEMIKPAGDVITIVGANDHNLAKLYLKGANLHTVLMLVPLMYGVGVQEQGHAIKAIAKLVAEGYIKPILDESRFELAEVAQAHRRLEAGEHFGKITVSVA